jgi:hypothetical protein
VGASDGFREGALLGRAVGATEGSTVGIKVGRIVGAADGEHVTRAHAQKRCAGG